MYLVCHSYRSAINIGSMRMFTNSQAVHSYLSSGQARTNGVRAYGLRVYYFDHPGAPSKLVTNDFRGSFK